MPSLSTASQQVKPNQAGPYTVLADADGDRPAWLAARRGIITAGEVPYILGMYGAGRRLRLWYDKAGWTERESADDFEGAQMGHRLEPLNAELFAERTGRCVTRVQKLLRSTRYPWLGATLDYAQLASSGALPGFQRAFLGDASDGRAGTQPPVPLELKSSGAKHNWPESESDVRYPDIEFVGEPSLRFQAQLQAQLLVYGADWGSLSALLGSPYMHHRYRDFPLHPNLCDLILTRTQAFAESLTRGVPPEPDDCPLTLSTIKEAALRRLQAATVRRLPVEAVAWSSELGRARAEQRDAERRVRLYESALLTAMGGAERARLPDGSTYTLQRSQRRGYSVAPAIVVSLKKEEP